MLKYLAKISMDIFPSVLATIIGAYIVNHYINAKSPAETPAAVVAPAEAGKDAKPTDTANLPAPGVKAKGVSEKAWADKTVTEKAAAEKSAAEVKAAETKAAEITPVESGAHGRLPARDANDLARAAIERLRKSPESKAAEARASEPKATEAKSTETKALEAKSLESKPLEAKPAEPVVKEAVRSPEAPRTVAVEPAPVRPLPPPITVSTPSAEAYGNGSPQGAPSYTASVGNDDPNRITPPADIPVPVIAPPLDLRADAGASMPRPKKTNVADDMLSGMKSMFHSVLPKGVTPD